MFVFSLWEKTHDFVKSWNPVVCSSLALRLHILAKTWFYFSSKNVQFVEHEVFMTARDGKKLTMKWRSKEQQRWNIPEDNLGSGSKISCGIFSFLHNWWRVTFKLRNKTKIIPVHVFTSSVSWSFFKLHQPPSLL